MTRSPTSSVTRSSRPVNGVDTIDLIGYEMRISGKLKAQSIGFEGFGRQRVGLEYADEIDIPVVIDRQRFGDLDARIAGSVLIQILLRGAAWGAGGE